LENEKLEKQREISETVIRVQETERTRIGHELHDNVNQILSTAKLFMDMMKADSSDQRTIKKKSIEYVVNAIEEIRKLSKELAVPHLKLEGLANSIRSVISDMSMAGSTKFTFENDEECESLSSGKKVTIFRIVQEQLKNIVKHSRARTAHIELRVHKNEVCLKIKDEGVGFDPSKSAAGIGLSNIYERAKFYEGKVEVKAAPGRGCEMVVILPIE